MNTYGYEQPGSNSGAGKGLGIAAIVCGAVGICVPLAALVGLILGVVGLIQARPGDKALPGIGIGVSAGSFILNILLMLAILLPALGAARSTAQMMQQATQLREISIANYDYSSDNKGRFPYHVAEIEPYLFGGTDIFIAPPAKPGDVPLTKTEDRPTKPYVYGSYEFMPLGGLSVDSFPDPSLTLIAWSAKPGGRDDLFFVCLFMDGHTEQLERAELERRRDESLRTINAMQRR